MPPPRCLRCPLPAALRRPRTAEPLCRRCFTLAFEDEAHRALTAPNRDDADGEARPPFPKSGETLAVAASGGKDSTVLAHLLRRLERRHAYGYRLVLVSVDEGIAGYREAALGAVRRGRGDLPLLVVSHRELFGWSVDEVAARLGGGSRCTFCGVFRRQALEKGARLLGVDWIVTGHNADDIAETVLMNFLRGDVARLRRAATEAGGMSAAATKMAAGATKMAAGATETPGEATRATKKPLKMPRRPPKNSWRPLKMPRRPPRMPQKPPKAPRRPPGTPWRPPRMPWGPPRTLWRPPKIPQRSPKAPRRPPRTLRRPPKVLQRPPRTLRRPPPAPQRSLWLRWPPPTLRWPPPTLR
uniref:Cytosolic thiouridylase subunit 1 n=1 Tax=Accipiter nisus TaxID=211598 RepID=A0A8B9MJL1_9AVES